MSEVKLDSLGRRIPKRTKEWGANIAKALSKKYDETCIECGTVFSCHRCRRGTAKYCSVKCKADSRRGRENPKAQKSTVTYSGIHEWAKRYIERTVCAHCGARNRMLHTANISGEYKRDLVDWVVLCVPCHSEFDGQTKVSNRENDNIIRLRNSGKTFREIGEMYDVTRKTISKRYYRVTNDIQHNK